MELKFRKLEAHEIDVRVAKISKNSVMLLLYKDARCDQNILDMAVGPMNWQRHHTRDNANCIVSIWDEDKKCWIEKEDTGKESFTEKEKGLASDSFKRACFNWGIGRELYTSPDLFFPIGSTNTKDGKCYDKFVVTEIEYIDNRISSVTILDTNTNKGKTFKGYDLVDGQAATEDIKKTEEVEKEKISPVKANALRSRCENANINIKEYLRMYHVSDFTELTEEQHSRMDSVLKASGY